MSTWTSSLRPRRTALVTSACLVVLSVPCAAWSASGTPAPVPDDPPAGSALTTTQGSGTTTTAATPKATRPVRQATQASSVPMPDAPPGSGAATASTTTRTVAPAPSPAPSPAPVSRPSTPAPAATTTPRTAPASNPKPARASPKRVVKVAKAKQQCHGIALLPRDVVRLGLPTTALLVAGPAEGPPVGLLVAAGLLFAAAAGGSLLLGVAARSATRHA